MGLLKASDLPAYAFLDPASGKKARAQGIKTNRARSAIVAARYEQAMGRVFTVRVRAGRWSPTQIVDEVISVNRDFRPAIFGIESSAQQYLFAETLGETARLKGERIPWAAYDQPTTIQKDDRIRNTLQPIIQMGRLFMLAPFEYYDSADPSLYLNKELKVLYEEIQGFPTAITKDAVDALASLVYHCLPPLKLASDENEELDELAAYLRSHGFSPNYIERRLAEASFAY